MFPQTALSTSSVLFFSVVCYLYESEREEKKNQ